MTKRKGKAADKWSLFPKLHEEVLELLKEDSLDYLEFNSQDDDASSIRMWDTNIMGRFKCHNNSCTSDGWSSKKIPITIRLYPDDMYNARVYRQQCRGCKSIGRPILDHSYAERVAYWIKKWKGIDMKPPPFTSKESKAPHQNSLCEGCKAGRCKEGMLRI